MTCSNPVTALTGDVDVVEALTCCEEEGPDDPPVPDDFVAVISHQRIQDNPFITFSPFVFHTLHGPEKKPGTRSSEINPEPNVLIIINPEGMPLPPILDEH